VTKFAAVFPGQGSQHPGMGKFLFDEFQSVKRLFEEASDTLSIDFKKLCFEGSEVDLAVTENTQPVILLVSVSAYNVLNDICDFKPLCTSGHSVGEYAALVTSQTIRFSDAIKAVRRRGQEMQKAVPLGAGAMAAVMGLTPNQVVELCKWVENETKNSPLEPANFNAPGQIVISGKKELVDWVIANFKKDIFTSEVSRVKFIPLKVSAPFHSSLMLPAENAMRPVLEAITFNNATFPVVQNFTARAETTALNLRENLIKQITGPVRWIECIETCKDMGTQKFIEFGAGRVLNGLIKKISPEHEVLNFNSLEELKTLELLLNQKGSSHA
jgi:[acyl-carrier-protein] S-malonyltransferase